MMIIVTALHTGGPSFILTNVSSYDIIKTEHTFRLCLEVTFMCMSLKIEPKEMAEVLIK